MSAGEASDAQATAYLYALSTALADGKIVGEEAEALARLAGAAGLATAQVAALNERFLESMREAPLEDDVLTKAEVGQLNAAAKQLGVPDYFDDSALGSATAPAAGASSGSTATRAARRCVTAGRPVTTAPRVPRSRANLLRRLAR